MVTLSKLTHDRRVQAPSLGLAPVGQQSVKSVPETRQRMEDCNVRSMAAETLALEEDPNATTAVTTKSVTVTRLMGNSDLGSMVVVVGNITTEDEGCTEYSEL